MTRNRTVSPRVWAALAAGTFGLPALFVAMLAATGQPGLECLALFAITSVGCAVVTLIALKSELGRIAVTEDRLEIVNRMGQVCSIPWSEVAMVRCDIATLVIAVRGRRGTLEKIGLPWDDLDASGHRDRAIALLDRRFAVTEALDKIRRTWRFDLRKAVQIAAGVAIGVGASVLIQWVEPILRSHLGGMWEFCLLLCLFLAIGVWRRLRGRSLERQGRWTEAGWLLPSREYESSQQGNPETAGARRTEP